MFQYFVENLDLKLDTLRNTFPGHYLFLRLPTKNTTTNKSITYHTELSNTDTFWFGSVDDNCEEYIVGINLKTGSSYRLRGFKGNDIFSLYRDIQHVRKFLDEEPISFNKFSRKYEVEHLDIRCLYNAFKHRRTDASRYPCLHTCEPKMITVHWKPFYCTYWGMFKVNNRNRFNDIGQTSATQPWTIWQLCLANEWVRHLHNPQSLSQFHTCLLRHPCRRTTTMKNAPT